MNTTSVLGILNSDQAVKQILLGVFPSDFLPNINSYPAALVINLDPSYKPGSHWVALYFSKSGTCDYFDSYGLPPPKDLVQYLHSNAKRFTYNNKQVQRFFTSTCGQMCIYFLIWRSRGIPFSEIVKSITNDEFITGFINALFNIRTQVYSHDFIVNQMAINMHEFLSKKP